MGTIWDIALRATHIIFAFITLGLSANLVATASPLQPIPFILVWATMVGVATLITSILGMASNGYERLEGKPMLLFDGCMVAANLAPGVLIAIGLKGAECSLQGLRKHHDGNHVSTMREPTIECSGQQDCPQPDGGSNYMLGNIDKAISRCLQSKADEAFMFLVAAAFLATFTLGWLCLRKGY